MHIALIRPNIGRLEHSLFVDEARMEPLELAVLAGLTPSSHRLSMLDDRVEDIDYDGDYDLVAVSIQTFTARRAYEICDEFRRRRVPVVAGGIHVTLAPEEAAGHADAVATGDAEGTWARILEDAEDGRLRARYEGRLGEAHPGVFPDRSIYGRRRYLPIALTQFSRGCPNRCDYCATGAAARGQCRIRRIDQVVREIAEDGRRSWFFVDDNIVADPRAARELFREIEGLKIRWVSQASLSMTGDTPLMEAMARSGGLGHVIGFESLDPRDLAAVGKTVNLKASENRYKEEIRVLRDYGMQTWAAFTLGYDHDTEDTIRRTLDFALENRFAFAAFNVLMPYPSTRFHHRLREQGRLLYDGAWWLHPAYRFNHAAFRPAGMTPDELTEAGMRCRSEFNSFRSILRRAFDFNTNMRSFLRLGIFALYAPLFRREAFKKHGMRLGLEEGEGREI